MPLPCYPYCPQILYKKNHIVTKVHVHTDQKKPEEITSIQYDVCGSSP